MVLTSTTVKIISTAISARLTGYKSKSRRTTPGCLVSAGDTSVYVLVPGVDGCVSKSGVESIVVTADSRLGHSMLFTVYQLWSLYRGGEWQIATVLLSLTLSHITTG